ncbi:unnamed protein product [Parnassius apollo]|uniref:(apollo) hypothetical protein n=1 Tax=Parnassius apollo TaxID=110799 RepID=A0A8S3WCZ9_PARAO|nr:unnamed protein product [Parnassius apollo]
MDISKKTALIEALLLEDLPDCSEDSDVCVSDEEVEKDLQLPLSRGFDDYFEEAIERGSQLKFLHRRQMKKCHQVVPLIRSNRKGLPPHKKIQTLNSWAPEPVSNGFVSNVLCTSMKYHYRDVNWPSSLLDLSPAMANVAFSKTLWGVSPTEYPDPPNLALLCKAVSSAGTGGQSESQQVEVAVRHSPGPTQAQPAEPAPRAPEATKTPPDAPAILKADTKGAPPRPLATKMPALATQCTVMDISKKTALIEALLLEDLPDCSEDSDIDVSDEEVEKDLQVPLSRGFDDYFEVTIERVLAEIPPSPTNEEVPSGCSVDQAVRHSPGPIQAQPAEPAPRAPEATKTPPDAPAILKADTKGAPPRPLATEMPALATQASNNISAETSSDSSAILDENDSTDSVVNASRPKKMTVFQEALINSMEKKRKRSRYELSTKYFTGNEDNVPNTEF